MTLLVRRGWSSDVAQAQTGATHKFSGGITGDCPMSIVDIDVGIDAVIVIVGGG